MQISIDGGKTFINNDEITKITKTLDLGGKEWQIIKIDNKKGELYTLYYNGNPLNLILTSDTDKITLTKEGKLIIKDKPIKYKNDTHIKITNIKLTRQLNGKIIALGMTSLFLITGCNSDD